MDCLEHCEETFQNALVVNNMVTTLRVSILEAFLLP